MHNFNDRAPPLKRRLACFVYEGVLLFGVVMLAGFIYGTLSNQRHALIGTTGLQAFVFLVLAVYFAGFWSKRGQTLAMQTWQIKVVGRGGEPVSWQRALARYILSWVWFVPALLALHLAGVKGGGTVMLGLSAGVVFYALLSFLRTDRQYWHDALCGTRLVWAPHPKKDPG